MGIKCYWLVFYKITLHIAATEPRKKEDNLTKNKVDLTQKENDKDLTPKRL